MFDGMTYLGALPGMLALGVIGWLISLPRRNVDGVDTLWPLMFLLAIFLYAGFPAETVRGRLLFVLVAIWALRLSIYITARNWGHEEDRRYQAIRARNQPGFAISSVYRVFAFQAVLAWVISLPLLGAVAAPEAPLGLLDYLGVTLWVIGFCFEAGGDWQLARFKRDPANAGKVLDRGFWRYTRHPNYFGDFAIWWGFYLIALSAGAWWSLLGPLLMSVLLLRVSGVALLEKDIGQRRPAYADYIRRTNAFFPGPRKD
jgi:steroid 5-alpha reductase family enzyme